MSARFRFPAIGAVKIDDVEIGSVKRHLPVDGLVESDSASVEVPRPWLPDLAVSMLAQTTLSNTNNPAPSTDPVTQRSAE